MEFSISTDWKGADLNHEPAVITLHDSVDGMKVEIKAPFFNDPGNPGGTPGEPFDQLWDYEVVEVFFLDSEKEEYLEAEFCPHGQHLLLVLKGRRNPWKVGLDLKTFESHINGSVWTGEATLPWGYFPENVDKLNAYAIHGSGDKRQYEALYPATGEHENPDFHRLEYFRPYTLMGHSDGKRRDPAVWE